MRAVGCWARCSKAPAQWRCPADLERRESGFMPCPLSRLLIVSDSIETDRKTVGAAGGYGAGAGQAGTGWRARSECVRGRHDSIERGQERRRLTWRRSSC